MPVEVDYITSPVESERVMKNCMLIAVVGNGCYETPDRDPDVCRGVEELVREATHAIFDGTTVYLYRCK
jgi:hypothetical protein